MLRQLVTAARNVSSRGGGPTNRVGSMRDEYLQWVELAESQVLGLTHDDDTMRMFQTDRFWHIRALEETSPRPWPLIDAEVRTQTTALTALADDLVQRAERLSSAPGEILVLDTNVLLHCLMPDQIPWRGLVGQPHVRLVVPLRVVEELDARKYGKSPEMAGRARRLLPALEAVVGDAGAPGQLRDGVTIEVPLDAGGRVKPTDADEEILGVCVELRQLAGREVILVTGDTAMRLRAQARAIPVLKVPDEYQRQRAAPED